MDLDAFQTHMRIAQLRRDLRANPSNAEVRVVLATLLWRGGASLASSSSSSTSSAAGMKARQRQVRDEALSLMEEARRLNPQCPETCNELAMMKKAIGQIDEAKALLQHSLVASGGRFCRAHRNLALLELRPSVGQGQQQKQSAEVAQSRDVAISHLMRAVEADSNDTASWYILGKVLEEAGMHDAAFEAVQTAAAVDTRNPSALLWLAKFYAARAFGGSGGDGIANHHDTHHPSAFDAAAASTRFDNTIPVSGNNDNDDDIDDGGDRNVVTANATSTATTTAMPGSAPPAASAPCTPQIQQTQHQTQRIGSDTSEGSTRQMQRRLLLLARNATRKDDLNRARTYYLQALQANPFDAELYFETGAFLEQLGSVFDNSDASFAALRCYRYALGCDAGGIPLKAARKEAVQQAAQALSHRLTGGGASSSASTTTNHNVAPLVPPLLISRNPPCLAAIIRRPHPLQFLSASPTDIAGHVIELFERADPKRSGANQQQQQQQHVMTPYWCRRTNVQCSLGHMMLLVRGKAYLGSNSLSCDSCSLAICSRDAEHGVLHCPLPCDTDLCPTCSRRWTASVDALAKVTTAVLEKTLLPESASAKLTWFARGAFFTLVDDTTHTVHLFCPAGTRLPSSSNSDENACCLVPSKVEPVTDAAALALLRQQFHATTAAATSNFQQHQDQQHHTTSSEKHQQPDFIHATFQLPPNAISLAALQDRITGDHPLHKGLHEFEARALVFHLLKSLASLHSNGLVLGSISPSTCFVLLDNASSTNGSVVTGVRFLPVIGLRTSATATTASTPTVFGIFNAHCFVAPEAIPGRSVVSVDHPLEKVDLWMAACTSLFLVAGSRPYKNVASSLASSDSSLSTSSSSPLTTAASNLSNSKPASIAAAAISLMSASASIRTRYRSLPSASFVLSVFISVYKQGSSPYSLDRLGTFVSRAFLQVVGSLLHVHAHGRVSAADALKHEYFAPMLSSAQEQQQQRHVHTIHAPWRSDLPDEPGFESSWDYSMRTSFRWRDLRSWYSEPPTPREALAVLDNHAFFADSVASLSAAWLVVAHALRLKEHSNNSGGEQQQQEAAAAPTTVRVKLPPHGLCVHEEIIAGVVESENEAAGGSTKHHHHQHHRNSSSSHDVISAPPAASSQHPAPQQQLYLRVDKLDCLRYALGRSVSSALLGPRGSGGIGGSSASQMLLRRQHQHHQNQPLAQLWVDQTRFNSPLPSGVGGMAGGEAAFNNSSRFSFALPHQGSMHFVSHQHQQLQLQNGGEDDDNENSTRRDQQQREQQQRNAVEFTALTIVFATHSDAVDIVHGVRQMMTVATTTATAISLPRSRSSIHSLPTSPQGNPLKFPAVTHDEKEEQSNNNNSSSSNAFYIHDIEVIHAHAISLSFGYSTAVAASSNNSTSSRRRLVSLRDLVVQRCRGRPLPEDFVCSFIAPLVLRRIDDSRLKDDDILHSVSPDSLFCFVVENNASDDDLSSTIQVLTDAIYAPVGFAAVAPNTAKFDVGANDTDSNNNINGSKSSSSSYNYPRCTQSDPLFHWALLVAWLILGGNDCFTELVQRAATLGWPQALAATVNAIVREQEEQLQQQQQQQGSSRDVNKKSGNAKKQQSEREEQRQQRSASSPTMVSNSNSAATAAYDDYNDQDEVVAPISPELLDLLQICLSEAATKPRVADVLAHKTMKQQSPPQSMSQLLPVRSQKQEQEIQPTPTTTECEGTSLQHWLKFWSDEAHSVRRLPNSHTHNRLDLTTMITSDATTNPVEWLLQRNSNDAMMLRKILLVVEGYGDTLLMTALLMSEQFGNMSGHRLFLSNPDDIRFLCAVDAAASGATTAGATAKNKGGKNKDKDKKNDTAATAAASSPASAAGSPKSTDGSQQQQQQQALFSMLRFFQEPTECRPDALIGSLSRYAGFDASSTRFLFLRDNDLKIVTPWKRLGTFEEHCAAKHFQVYHRLRCGRAVENYILPYSTALTLLQRDPKFAFVMTLASFSTVALLYFPVMTGGDDALFPGRPGDAWLSWVDGYLGSTDIVTVDSAAGSMPASSGPTLAATATMASAAQDSTSGSGGGGTGDPATLMSRVFAQQLVKQHIVKTAGDLERLKPLWQLFLNTVVVSGSPGSAAAAAEAARSEAGLIRMIADSYRSAGDGASKQQQQQQQLLLSPAELARAITPSAGGPQLVWPLLPQFANWAASLLASELRAFVAARTMQEQRDQTTTATASLEEWSSALLKWVADPAGTHAKIASQLAKASSSSAGNAAKAAKQAQAVLQHLKPEERAMWEQSRVVLPSELRHALRDFLAAFHRGVWQMHLGDGVAPAVVDFIATGLLRTEQTASASSSTSCPGLLLGLPAGYTPRKLLDMWQKQQLDSSPDPACLDQLCLACARPVREHDAMFKLFSSQQQQQQQTQVDAAHLHRWLDALCLHCIYSADSHPLMKFAHGNEGCLAEHLELYPNLPHVSSPGDQIVLHEQQHALHRQQQQQQDRFDQTGSPVVAGSINNAAAATTTTTSEDSAETRRCREELQRREEIHLQHIGVALGAGFCGAANTALAAASCSCCQANEKDAIALLRRVEKLTNSNSSSSSDSNNNNAKSEEHDDDDDEVLRRFLQLSSAKELLSMRQQELKKIVGRVRDACFS